jgi:D-alanyl-D-alanine carboxypeptidase
MTPTRHHAGKRLTRFRLRTPALVVGVLVLAALVAVLVDRAVSSQGKNAQPDLQRVLDRLVTGPQRVAPGASAYVLGPHGAWVGSAGVANTETGARMRPDARLRIQSNSKTWLLAVVLQLAEEGELNLDDSVSRWLPGLLPYGDRITIRELMTDTSGLIDDNDLDRTPSAGARYLARVKDAKLRAQLAAIGARVKANPSTPVAPIWFIRLAAWQPLLFTPGSQYHHSNIGWNIAGLIAARAGGKPLPVLYRERIFKPLGLTHTSYQPQGPIARPHDEGYTIRSDGSLIDATAWTYGKGADGAIVSDAADEATFLRALASGKLHVRGQLLAFYGASADNGSGCPGDPFAGTGAGAASRSYVYYENGGNHVAVLLLNGFRRSTAAGDDPEAEAAARDLYCAA